MVKWVVFDLSGVIFTEGFKPACRRIATTFTLNEKAVSESLLGEPASRYRLGEEEPAVFWRGFAETFGVQEVELAKKLFFDSYSLRGEAVEFVTRVRTVAKTAFFTFSPPDRAAYHEEKYSFLQYFDAGFYTSDVGAKKSDPVAYERLCGKLGAEPSEVLFIDDKEEYLQAAKAAGLHVVKFDLAWGFENVASALRKLGINVPVKSEDSEDDHEKIPM